MDELDTELRRLVAEYLKDSKEDAGDMVEAIRASAIRVRGLMGQPGFEAAVKAERDQLAIRAGIKAVKRADHGDRAAFAMLDTALGVLMRV